MPNKGRRFHDGLCLEAGCDAPREVARSGHVYQRCHDHERRDRGRLHAEHVGSATARRTTRRLDDLADRMGWRRPPVRRKDADAALATIAALPRPLPRVCGPCFEWEMWTGRARECSGCRRGLREKATNDAYRQPPRQASEWTSRWSSRDRGGGRRARRRADPIERVASLAG